MAGRNFRVAVLFTIFTGLVGTIQPAPKISRTNTFKTKIRTSFTTLKRFFTFDYLRHCECPNHQKNQTLKNQIRRHPERLALYAAAGAGLIFGAYKLFSFGENPEDQKPTPPPSPRPPAPQPVVPDPDPVHPVNLEPNPAPAPAPIQDYRFLEIPAHADNEHGNDDSDIHWITYQQLLRQRQEERQREQEQYMIPVEELRFATVSQAQELILVNRLYPQAQLVHAAPQLRALQNTQVAESHELGNAVRLYPFAFNQRIRSNSKGKEEASDEEQSPISNSWHEIERCIPADPTPGIGELLTMANWNALYEVGQIASGELKPIIDFMLKNMPQANKVRFDQIVRQFHDQVIFAIERDHVSARRSLDQEKIKNIFRAFQQKISDQNWHAAANSFDEDEIKNCKVLFWLCASHQLEQNAHEAKDPQAVCVLAKLSVFAREMAQELLMPMQNNSPKVEFRKLGGISTAEHDWIQKRLAHVFEAQKKAINPHLKKHFIDGLEKPLKIGICLSGGGYRAMTLSAGYLTGLEKLGLLDSALYVSGLSGSTWFMMRWLLSNPSAHYCKNQLQQIIPRANLLHLFSRHEKLDLARLVHDVIIPKAVFHKPITSIDVFGGLLARALLQDCAGERRHRITMHDIAERIQNAQYPFPICTAISQPAAGADDEDYVWYEYNPFEVENNTIGLSIPAHAYGNKWNNGVVVEPSPAESIGTQMATWGSAYTVNFANKIDQEKTGVIGAYAASTIAPRILPAGIYNNGRISPAQTYNPWYQLKDQPSTINNQELCTFIDAGINFNLPLIPLLKRARGLDVIIVGDASGSSNILREKLMPDGSTTCPKELAKFFQSVAKYGIMYERKDIGASESNFSIYVPQDYSKKREPVWIEGEKLPIIIYFNFISTPAMIDKAMQDTDLKKLVIENNLREFDAQKCLSDYGHTFKFEYSSDNFRQLAAVGELNIRLHHEEIMQTLAYAYGHLLDE